MHVYPTLNFEKELWQSGKTRLVGLDEVGRGAFCASVVAAAVILPPDETRLRELAEVRDSKMLSRETRERLVVKIRQVALSVGIGAASPAEIEKYNIRVATAIAMKRALKQVGHYEHMLVDGLRVKELGLERQTAIVKGDAFCLSIACASVIAKVCRDRLMIKLAERYPGYGWEHNVGYGTAEHLEGLAKLGPTRHHRRNYAPIKALLEIAVS
jgi:ribonuclease HII